MAARVDADQAGLGRLRDGEAQDSDGAEEFDDGFHDDSRLKGMIGFEFTITCELAIIHITALTGIFSKLRATRIFGL